jgi:hypothetical protein
MLASRLGLGALYGRGACVAALRWRFAALRSACAARSGAMRRSCR